VDGRLELFGHASGGTGLEIVHAWQNAPGADWGTWGTLGTPSLDALGDVVLGENGDGRLELFARVGLMSSGTIGSSKPSGIGPVSSSRSITASGRTSKARS
jgi:hypothetical protein